MYPEEVYENLRKTNPNSFHVARTICVDVLDRGILLVRGLVTCAPQNHRLQIAQIEVFGLEQPHTPEWNVLFRLRFRGEINFGNNESFLDTAIYVDGPTWNGKLITKSDIKNQVAVAIDEWWGNKSLVLGNLNQWIDSPSAPFVGCLVLSANARTFVPACHEMMMPYICMCLGSFNGTFKEKLSMMTSSTDGSADIRKKAFLRFAKSLNSFGVQVQRENTRNCLGNFIS